MGDDIVVTAQSHRLLQNRGDLLYLPIFSAVRQVALFITLPVAFGPEHCAALLLADPDMRIIGTKSCAGNISQAFVLASSPL